MAGRQAKVIRPAQYCALLRHIRRHADPERSRVIVLLSLKAGLRAAEIAQLEWPMVLDANGKVQPNLFLDGEHFNDKGYALINPAMQKLLVSLNVPQSK